MGTRVNVDTFYYGPRYTSWLWTLKRRHPLAYLKNRMEWYYYPKRHVVPVFPLHVDFEVSSLCNMTCPMCFRSRSEYDPSLFGNMSLEIFKKGIDECVKYNLYSIRLSWKGECTVNPYLVEMINYARKKGIKEISFISNGYRLDGDLARDIVKAGVDYITISVDGLEEEYNRVRDPSNFEGTVKRLKDLRKLRDSMGNGFPRIRINSVWQKHKDLAWFNKMYQFFNPFVDYMTFTPEYAYDRKEKKLRPNFTCQYPFQRITIMWNGKIPLCIADKKCDYQLGDLEKDNIYDLWHGDNMDKARKIHLQHQAKDIKCCSVCDRAVTKQVGNVVTE